MSFVQPRVEGEGAEEAGSEAGVDDAGADGPVAVGESAHRSFRRAWAVELSAVLQGLGVTRLIFEEVVTQGALIEATLAEALELREDVISSHQPLSAAISGSQAHAAVAGAPIEAPLPQPATAARIHSPQPHPASTAPLTAHSP